jgi:cell wall-associated NlpC family hydrolase
MKAVWFVRDVIGLPWSDNGHGPDSYSCWGLTRECQRAVFGRDLPIINHPATLRSLIETIEHHEIRDAWPEVKKPVHGDLVTMTHARHPHHIGVYLGLDGGRVLHSTEQTGVMCCSLTQLKLEGFVRLRFHRYRAPLRSSSEAVAQQ